MKSTLSILLFAIVAVAILSLAAAAEMKRTPPADVSLAGLWQLNPDLSDDPRPEIQRHQQHKTPRRPTRD